jgi:hypothetical protein
MKTHVLPKNTHVVTKNTIATVVSLARIGWDQERIATTMGITLNTFRKYYREPFHAGKLHAQTKVTETLYSIATNPNHKGCVAANIFIHKTQLGFREVTRTEITGPNGGPLQAQFSVGNVIDPRGLSPDQRENLRDIVSTALIAQQEAGEDDEPEDDVVVEGAYDPRDFPDKATVQAEAGVEMVAEAVCNALTEGDDGEEE